MNKAVSATHTHTLLHSSLVIIHLRFFLGSKHAHVIRRRFRVFFTLPAEWQFSLTDGNFTRSYPGPISLVIQLCIVPVSVQQNSWSTPHTFSQPARTQQLHQLHLQSVCGCHCGWPQHPKQQSLPKTLLQWWHRASGTKRYSPHIVCRCLTFGSSLIHVGCFKSKDIWSW